MLDIGSQCSFASCNQIDFLPILCGCKKLFCKDHILPDAHACPLTQQPTPSTSKTWVEKLWRCEVVGCTKATLGAYLQSEASSFIGCAQCHKSFCVDHRHADSHSCPGQDSLAPRESDAARLIAQNFPAKVMPTRVPSHNTKIPTDPAKRTQYDRVQLMKMRHRAAPGDPKDKSASVLPDHRVHVKIQIDEKTEKIFWFRKTVIIGKVLDHLASHLKMTSTDSSPLQLCMISPDGAITILSNSQACGAQLQDGCMVQISPSSN
ncbi:hypothetical protein BD779DRAFT_1205602 [Infundibulicybe gibba]|nr:hypothetical protein BD779DRAFT_1205602 [Infundibulicybe gibba]